MRAGDARNEQQYGYQGNRWCKETIVRPVKLTFAMDKAPADTTTVVRFVPSRYKADDKVKLTPWLDESDPEKLTPHDWLQAFWAVRGIGGENGYTFFLSKKPKSEFDFQNNPVVRVVRGLDKAIENENEKPGWAKMRKGKKGTRALIPGVGMMYVAPGIIYAQGEKEMAAPLGLGPTDKLCAIDLGSSAGDELTTLMLRERSDWDGRVNDYAKRYKIGRDPISLRPGCGLFFSFFPKGKDPRPEMAEANRIARNKKKPDIGYGVFAKSKFQDYSADLSTLGAAMDDVKRRTFNWDDVLLFPSFDEQAAMLARVLDPGVLIYCWRDFPEWLTANGVYDKAKNRTHVDMGESGDPQSAYADDDDDAPRRRRPTGGGRARPADDDVVEEEGTEDDIPFDGDEPGRKAPARRKGPVRDQTAVDDDDFPADAGDDEGVDPDDDEDVDSADAGDDVDAVDDDDVIDEGDDAVDDAPPPTVRKAAPSKNKTVVKQAVEDDGVEPDDIDDEGDAANDDIDDNIDDEPAPQRTPSKSAPAKPSAKAVPDKTPSAAPPTSSRTSLNKLKERATILRSAASRKA